MVRHVSLFEVSAEWPELVVRSPATSATYVRLFDWARVDEHEIAFAVEVVGDGLRARLDSVSVSVWGRAGDLTEFLDGLARDFRGWEGERSWVTNRLVLTATFHSGGHVQLSWGLRSGIFAEDAWQCLVTTTLEAGEQMSRVASDVRSFLHQG
ncbi:permease [Streptomyces sp. BR123]|nr:permease [Streptomyces sp. BR123]